MGNKPGSDGKSSGGGGGGNYYPGARGSGGYDYVPDTYADDEAAKRSVLGAAAAERAAKNKPKAPKKHSKEAHWDTYNRIGTSSGSGSGTAAASASASANVVRTTGGSGATGGGGTAGAVLPDAKPWETEAEAAVRFERLNKLQGKALGSKPQAKAAAAASAADRWEKYQSIAGVVDAKQQQQIAQFDATHPGGGATTTATAAPTAGAGAAATKPAGASAAAAAGAGTVSAAAPTPSGASGASRASGAAAAGADEREIDLVLHHVLRTSPATIALVRRVLENIARPPTGKDPATYRRISLAVERVQQLIVAVPGVVDALCALGFAPTEADGKAYLQFPADGPVAVVALVCAKMDALIAANPSLAPQLSRADSAAATGGSGGVSGGK